MNQRLSPARDIDFGTQAVYIKFPASTGNISPPEWGSMRRHREFFY